MQKIILASGSVYRRQLLADAGIEADWAKPPIDERTIEESVADAGLAPEDLASLLAEAKAMSIAEDRPDALVIGCDQVLSLGDEVLHKPADMEQARRRLLKLSGRTHQLSTAAVIVKDAETVWRHTDVAHLTMRDLDPAFVGRHLARVGDKALTSVGAYQIEGEGIQLFEAIEGSHFTIVGLPMLALLKALRRFGAIDG